MGEQKWVRLITRAHELHLTVTVLDHRGVPLKGWGDLPVTAMSWRVDASTRPGLSGSLTVPIDSVDLGNRWVPKGSDAPLTPFGNGVEVSLEVTDGAESQSVRIGFGVISEVTVNRPEHTIQVQLVDQLDVILNSRMKRPRPSHANDNHTNWWWFKEFVDKADIPAWRRAAGSGDVLKPHVKGLTIRDPDEHISRTHKITHGEKWSAGTSNMDALDNLADRGVYPAWVYFDRNGVLRVREPSMSAVDTAPPVAGHVITGGTYGTLQKSVTTITRVDAINELTVRQNDPRKNHDNKISTAYITKGPMKRDRIGMRNQVEEVTEEWSQADLNQYTRARLKAKGGARRQATFTALINPWIDPGDTVEVKSGGASELFVVRAVEFMIPQGLMRIEAAAWLNQTPAVKTGDSPNPAPEDDDGDDSSGGGGAPEGGGRYPHTTHYAAQRTATNNGPGSTETTKNCKASLDALDARWYGKLQTVSTYRNTAYTADPDHYWGQAIDIGMTGANYSTNNPALGNEIVAWYIRHQLRFGIKYVIWGYKFWGSSGTQPGGLDYGNPHGLGSTSPHVDHIHLSHFSYAKGGLGRVYHGSYWDTADTKLSLMDTDQDVYGLGGA